MSLYRIAICDDDDIVKNELSSLCHEILSEEEITHSITTFSSAVELEKRINSESCSFDLLILDIQMNGMTGMELAHSLRDRGNRVSIIFVTACDDYLSEGYDVQPIHFLLKPIRCEALANALHTDLKLNHLPKTIVLHIGSKLLQLAVADIKYIESYNHSIIIHQGTEESSYYYSLGELEKQLPAGQFARCHNSYLVNLNEVQAIGRTELSLHSGETIPVGRTYYQAFQSAFIRFINQ